MNFDPFLDDILCFLYNTLWVFSIEIFIIFSDTVYCNRTINDYNFTKLLLSLIYELLIENFKV